MTQSTVGSVEEAMERAIEVHGDVGVQVTAYRHGELIADAWAGTVDEGADAAPVDGDSLFTIFSVSKAVTATALHLQVDRGLVSYGAPVGTYWPEFASHGKEATTVYDVLTHRAGVPVMPVGVTPDLICDWEWMTSRLAAMVPIFEPGSRVAYLSHTFGWLIGEIVRRTDPQQRPFSQFVREEVCDPLGMDDFYFGITDEAEPRTTMLIDVPPSAPPLAPGALILSAMPPSVATSRSVFCRPDVRRACIPASGGVSNTRSLARLFAMYAGGGELDGTRLLSERTVRYVQVPAPPVDYDYVYGIPNNVTVGAMHLAAPIGNQEIPRGMSPAGSLTAFGHPGAGGQLGWADQETGLACAILRNKMLQIHELDRDDNPIKDIADAVIAAAGL